MNSSKNYYSTDRTFMTMMFLALMVGFVFFVTNSLDFLITSVSNNKVSVSNMAYLLVKTISTIIIPLIFIVPSAKKTGRIKAIKAMFIILGIVNLLSLSWLIPFIAENGFAGLFSDSVITAYQLPEGHSIVPSIVFWDTYSWIGCLFTIIFSVICICLGICFDDTKGKVCITMTILTVFRIAAPLLLDLILKKQFFSGLWLTYNYVDVASWILITLAMFVAASYDETWIVLVWDQDIPQNEDEEQ